MGAWRDLDEDTRRRVVAMLDDGAPYNEVAETFGISPKRLEKQFPGRGWTEEQTAEHLRTLRLYGYVLDTGHVRRGDFVHSRS